MACALVLGACANDPPQQTSYVPGHRPPVATADATPKRAQPAEQPPEPPLAKSTPKETAATLGRLAKRSLDEGNVDGAVQLYRRSLSLDSTSLPVTLGLAEALYRQTDFRNALEIYRQALRFDPVNDEGLRGIGKTLIALDRPKEAIEQYTRALARRPSDPKILNGLGVALDMTGDHSAAQQKYRAALLAAPNDVNVQNNLGLSLALSGEFKPSLDALTQLVSSPAATPRNRQNLALVYGLLGDDEKAAYYAGQDLTEEQVKRNLAYYAQLRQTNNQARSAAVFGINARPAAPHLQPGPSTSALPQLPGGASAPPAGGSSPLAREDATPRPAEPAQAALPLTTLAPAAGKAATDETIAKPEPVAPAAVPPSAGLAPAPAATGLAPAKPLHPAEPKAAGAVPSMPGPAKADGEPSPEGPAKPAAPRKAAAVDSEPSSLRSFLQSVLSAASEPPPAAKPAGDDPEPSAELRQQR